MCHPTLSAMFAKHESVSDAEDNIEDKEIVKGDIEYERRCFMEATSRSLITDNEHNLLISFNIPSNFYDSVLSDIDDSCAYLNNILISLSSDAENAYT